MLETDHNLPRSPGAGEPSDGAAGPRRVRSAERVAAVLELLSRSPAPMRHGDVAASLGLAKSSTTNLLDTLADVGLVRRDERGYALGIKLIELGAAAAESLDVRGVARPVLQQLSGLGIGTANLAVLRGHEVLYIEKLTNPDHVIQISTRVGGAAPAHATALGKVLVAALPAPERRRWLDEHAFTPVTEHTIRSAAAFERALDVAAAQGYALDDEEQNLRILCIAAPVRDHTGAAIAALSLTCLSAEVRGHLSGLIAEVTAGAGRVSAALGAGSR